MTPSGAHDRGIIAFVGDSNISKDGYWLVWDLTHGKGGLLTSDHLDNNYVPAFVARAGAGIRTPDCLARDTSCPTDDYWTLKLRATLKKLTPDAIVTDLGINDAFSRGSAKSPGYASYSAKIDYFMRLIPEHTSVFWSTLPCAIEPAATRTGCRKINASLHAASKRWHNLAIVDWARTAAGHHGYMDGSAPPNLRVHYSDAGYAAWSALITKALDARFPAPK